MNFLKTIGSRIIFVVAILIAFSALVGGTALYGLNTLTDGANEIIKQNDDLVFVFRAQVKINTMIRAEKDFVLTGNEKFITEHSALRADIQKDLDDVKEKLETEVERSKLQDILDAVESYDAGFAQIKTARELGTDEAIAEAERLTQESSNLLAVEMNKIIGEIVEGRETKVAEVGASANAASNTVNLVEIVSLLIAIILGAILAVWLVRSTNRTLQDAINRLIAASDTVFGYTTQLTGEQEKLTTIVNQVSQGSASQSQQVEANTKNMSDLRASLGDTAENAKNAAAKTATASELATKGTEAGQEAVTRLKAIDDIVKQNTEIVKEVDQRADEVAAIVVTIRDVADQINLLALNAAIEAARAGDAGRGFAVVADEVRKLAEQATKNVAQVDILVKAVKERAGAAVSNLNEGSTQVAESTKIVNNALGILDQISTAAQEIAAGAQEISTANAQQTASAQQLSSALESVASSAEQNTSGAQQATASVKVVADIVAKTVVQSKDLTQLSKELQALIGAAKTAAAQITSQVERATATGSEPQA